MSNWVGGFLAGAGALAVGAGAGALAVGFLIGKDQPRSASKRSHKKRFHGRDRRYRFARRRGINPGWQQRQIEREYLAFLREARETMRTMNKPAAPPIDAEFVDAPKTAMSCHIQRAWPEGSTMALCGADRKFDGPLTWGGILTTTCPDCFRYALYAGHQLNAPAEAYHAIMGRLKEMGLEPADASYHSPSSPAGGEK